MNIIDQLANRCESNREKTAGILDVAAAHPIEAALLGALAGGTILGSISYRKSKEKDKKEKIKGSISNIIAGAAMGAGAGTLISGVSSTPKKVEIPEGGIGNTILGLLGAGTVGASAGSIHDSIKYSPSNNNTHDQITLLDERVDGGIRRPAIHNGEGRLTAEAVIPTQNQISDANAARGPRMRISRMMEGLGSSIKAPGRDMSGVGISGILNSILNGPSTLGERAILNGNPKNIIVRALDSVARGKLRNPAIGALLAGGLYGIGTQLGKEKE